MDSESSSSPSTETESSSAAEESATPLPSESSSSESSESSDLATEFPSTFISSGSSESSSSDDDILPQAIPFRESTGGYPRMFSGSQPAPAPVIVEPTGPVTLSHLDLRDLFTREIARLKHLLDEVRPLTVEHLRETLFKKHL